MNAKRLNLKRGTLKLVAAAPSRAVPRPEALLVACARTGDRDAYAELVTRRQSWIRNLMRRCCGDATLADDLAQQVFLQAWRDIGKLREPARFAGWLKRLAVNVWLQHARAHDPLQDAQPFEAEIHSELPRATPANAGLARDLDHALLELPQDERLCIVLSYNEGMTHAEIAELAGLPLGTVKSHIKRGAARLRDTLSAYAEPAVQEEVS